MSSPLSILDPSGGPRPGELRAPTERPAWVTFFAFWALICALDHLVAGIWISTLFSPEAFLLVGGPALLAAVVWALCAVALWRLQPFARIFLLTAGWSGLALAVASSFVGAIQQRRAQGWLYAGNAVGIVVSAILLLVFYSTTAKKLFYVYAGIGKKVLAATAAVAALLVARVLMPAGLAVPLLYVRTDRPFELPPVSVEGVNIYIGIVGTYFPGSLSAPLPFLVRSSGVSRPFLTEPPPPPPLAR